MPVLHEKHPKRITVGGRQYYSHKLLSHLSLHIKLSEVSQCGNIVVRALTLLIVVRTLT